MNISSFSSKSGIQYLEQGEISICKVLVLIKVVPGERMIISFIENLNCIDSKWMGFFIGAVFTEKIWRIY